MSTDDQRLHLQLDALTTAGCTQIFHDEGISGRRCSAPAWLPRWRRSPQAMCWWSGGWIGSGARCRTSSLGLQGVGCQSLTEAIHTTTAGGKLVFHIMGPSRHLRAP